jgi:hypothetical protein
MKTTIKIVSLIACLLFPNTQAGEIIVIGNNNVPKMDAATVSKVYTGKYISVAGVSVSPIGLKPGNSTRNRFLQDFLHQDEEKYDAYWTVRRYIGKGTPPPEMATTAELISYVQATPGAIGYLDAADVKHGISVNVVAKVK